MKLDLSKYTTKPQLSRLLDSVKCSDLPFEEKEKYVNAIIAKLDKKSTMLNDAKSVNSDSDDVFDD